jgi:hypothetical protein
MNKNENLPVVVLLLVSLVEVEEIVVDVLTSVDWVVNIVVCSLVDVFRELVDVESVVVCLTVCVVDFVDTNGVVVDRVDGEGVVT